MTLPGANAPDDIAPGIIQTCKPLQCVKVMIQGGVLHGGRAPGVDVILLEFLKALDVVGLS